MQTPESTPPTQILSPDVPEFNYDESSENEEVKKDKKRTIKKNNIAVRSNIRKPRGRGNNHKAHRGQTVLSVKRTPKLLDVPSVRDDEGASTGEFTLLSRQKSSDSISDDCPGEAYGRQQSSPHDFAIQGNVKDEEVEHIRLCSVETWTLRMSQKPVVGYTIPEKIGPHTPDPWAFPHAYDEVFTKVIDIVTSCRDVEVWILHPGSYFGTPWILFTAIKEDQRVFRVFKGTKTTKIKRIIADRRVLFGTRFENFRVDYLVERELVCATKMETKAFVSSWSYFTQQDELRDEISPVPFPVLDANGGKFLRPVRGRVISACCPGRVRCSEDPDLHEFFSSSSTYVIAKERDPVLEDPGSSSAYYVQPIAAGSLFQYFRLQNRAISKSIKDYLSRTAHRSRSYRVSLSTIESFVYYKQHDFEPMLKPEKRPSNALTSSSSKDESRRSDDRLRLIFTFNRERDLRDYARDTIVDGYNSGGSMHPGSNHALARYNEILTDFEELGMWRKIEPFGFTQSQIANTEFL
jgi:hypothetical protein